MKYYQIIVNTKMVEEYSDTLLTAQGLETDEEKLLFVIALSQPYIDIDPEASILILILEEEDSVVSPTPFFEFQGYDPIYLN